MNEAKEKIINMRQTAKYQNGKVLFEINDDLKRAGYDEREKKEIRDLFGKIHARYSGFKIVARDYSKGTGDNLIDVSLRLGPEEVKTITEDVLSKIQERKSYDMAIKANETLGKQLRARIIEREGQLVQLSNQLAISDDTQKQSINAQIKKVKDDLATDKMCFAQAQYSYKLATAQIELMSEKVFYEQKIAPEKIKDSQYSKVTALTIEYNTKMNIPWTLIVENGEGIREQTNTGGYKIKSGSYKQGAKVRLFLNDNDIRKLFRKAADYTRAWECANISSTMKQRHVFEKADREEYFKNMVK